ncbi:GtrA family protein [Lysobacter solisilvae (ex Woo and Kim 2020)]|uniref:GtrA family protein n=1 Tax=Agrilutibacter terrestris TaxID=2865112 RepID=A0A7H0G025_9GAMM|nr:GtrA family protein [Lysobacter terrestris]QNP41641.1 GtrA family protein [Lysobacter terrestris]
MSLLRQGSHYIAIGLLQYLVDWGAMVTLSHFGVPVELANVAGRVSGAVLGFWLNGRITFADENSKLGPQQLRRFLLLWLVMTGMSTWAIGSVADLAGLRWAWAAKPAVELLLACISFGVSRHWVYRR